MGLKETKLIKLKKKERSPLRRMIGGTATALIGVAFISELSNLIRRI